jgi:hypothetical protein
MLLRRSSPQGEGLSVRKPFKRFKHSSELLSVGRFRNRMLLDRILPRNRSPRRKSFRFGSDRSAVAPIGRDRSSVYPSRTSLLLEDSQPVSVRKGSPGRPVEPNPKGSPLVPVLKGSQPVPVRKGSQRQVVQKG